MRERMARRGTATLKDGDVEEGERGSGLVMMTEVTIKMKRMTMEVRVKVKMMMRRKVVPIMVTMESVDECGR